MSDGKTAATIQQYWRGGGGGGVFTKQATKSTKSDLNSK